MRHNVQKLKLGLPRDQRKNLIGNLATSLVLHEKIKTTVAKAKALQPIMDKIINMAKQESRKDAIRDISPWMQNELGSRKLIEDLAKRFAKRKSGYTRITNLGFRPGDAAPVVQIELVDKA
jgi:large subunit ribosomal protein L17